MPILWAEDTSLLKLRLLATQHLEQTVVVDRKVQTAPSFIQAIVFHASLPLMRQVLMPLASHHARLGGGRKGDIT